MWEPSDPPPLPTYWAHVLTVLVRSCDAQSRMSTPEITSLVARQARAGQTIRAALRGLRRRGYVEGTRKREGGAVQWQPTDLGRRYVELRRRPR